MLIKKGKVQTAPAQAEEAIAEMDGTRTPKSVKTKKALGKAGGVATTTAAGAAVGTLICPGLGSVIGGAVGTLVYLPLTIGYYRNRHIGIYPAWMLKLMLVKLWGEFTALFLIYAVTIGIGAEALGGLIPLLVTTIAETVYFANRESQAYV